MSDHAEDTCNDANNRKPLFCMDLFGIHLASRLVGRDNVLNLFQSNSISQPQPVDGKPICVGYWKTPLLYSSSSTTTSTSSNDNWNVVFVDVTVELVYALEQQHQVTSTIGILLQQQAKNEQEQQVRYVTAEPLCFSQLKAHCDEIGIDIESTSPDAIAHSLGTALMALSSQRVSFSNQPQTASLLSLRLEYQDLQETGSLTFKASQVDSFNDKSFAMMLQNLQRLDVLEANANTNQDDKMETVHDSQAAAVLTRAFENTLNTWKQGSEEVNTAKSTVESMNSAAATLDSRGCSKNGSGKENVAATCKTGEETTLSTITETTTSLPPVETKSDKNDEEQPKKQPQPPPVKRPQAGFVRVSNPKRKRRGKLTFAKQGD